MKKGENLKDTHDLFSGSSSRSRNMGKMKTGATVFGTNSQRDRVCRTLVEVLRTAGPEGIPIKRLNDVSVPL
jgi:hypothetical protein